MKLVKTWGLVAALTISISAFAQDESPAEETQPEKAPVVAPEPVKDQAAEEAQPEKAPVVAPKPVKDQGAQEDRGYRYNYGYFNYDSLQVDGATESLTGFSFGGNSRVGEIILLGVSYGNLSVSSGSISSFGAGVSFLVPVSDVGSLAIGGGFSNLTISSGGNSLSETQTSVSARLLLRTSERGQIGIGVTSSEGEPTFGVGSQIFLGKSAALNFGLSANDVAMAYTFGVSFFL